jgi:hypothetical protein
VHFERKEYTKAIVCLSGALIAREHPGDEKELVQQVRYSKQYEQWWCFTLLLLRFASSRMQGVVRPNACGVLVRHLQQQEIGLVLAHNMSRCVLDHLAFSICN